MPLEAAAKRLPRGNVRSSLHYQLREAARFAGVPWHIFERQDPEWQAAILAHHECAGTLAALEADDLKRKNKKA